MSIMFDLEGSYIDFEDGSIGDRVREHYSEEAWVDLEQEGWEDWDHLQRLLHVEGGLPLDEANAIVAKVQQQRARLTDEHDRYYSGVKGALRRVWEVAAVSGVLIAVLAVLAVIVWIATNIT